MRLALAILPLVFSAAARDPSVQKPVTLVVGFAAGGASRRQAAGAPGLGRRIGQSVVVVDNKGGGLATSRTSFMAMRRPMALLFSGLPTIAPHLMKLPMTRSRICPGVGRRELSERAEVHRARA